MSKTMVKPLKALSLEISLNHHKNALISCEDVINSLVENLCGVAEEQKERLIVANKESIVYHKEKIEYFEKELSKHIDVELNDEFYAQCLEEMNGQDKWTINDYIRNMGGNLIPMYNGYFGGFTCITFYNKQAIVYVDDRDAIVHFVTPFYDHIYYNINGMRWHGDTRFGQTNPFIFVKNNDQYNIISSIGRYGSELVLSEWLKNIDTNRKYNSIIGYHYDVETLNGIKKSLSPKGYFLQDNRKEMEFAKSLSRDEILEKWIKANKLVVGGYGFEYRGAGNGIIDNETAAKNFHKYHFGMGYYELSWVEYNGQVALSMREYSENDLM